MRKELYVISGTLYEGEIDTIGNDVAVPSHFYKIILDVKTKNAIAFITPHEKTSTKDKMPEYIVSIDEIEERSGFDFFALIEDDREDEIEQFVESGVWATSN